VDAPLNPPVIFASTYIGAHEVSAAEIGYGRYGNPTWQALEQAIGALEGGRALTFASGMAAAHAVLELMPRNAVVVIPRNCYLGVAEAIDRRATKYDWQVRRIDVADTPEVLSAAEGADLVWIESPTNPTIEVADLPALGESLPGEALFELVALGFGRPRHQRRDHLRRGQLAGDHSSHVFDDGQLHIMFGSQFSDRCAGLHTFRDLSGRRGDLCDGTSPAELLTEAPVPG
jgi:Cys/Met metabolism PLP-dependent enzyme